MQNWSEVKRSQFARDLKSLMEAYGIAYITDMTVQNHGQFAIVDGYMYTYTGKGKDDELAEQVIHSALVDKALDDGDREAFDRLMSIHCADCDAKIGTAYIRCRKCGKPMCTRCHGENGGVCNECEYPNARRYV